MSKTSKILFAVLAIVLCLSVGAAVFFAHRYFTELSGKLDAMQTGLAGDIAALQEKVDAIPDRSGEEGQNGPTQENDVTIAGDYVIRATTNISDAYLSGSTDGLTDKEKETLDMASAVLKDIITDGMSDYEKELAVYEWMTSSLQNDPGLLPVVPTTQADADNPYGVLKYHNAVCVGYATTFRLFMQMMNIPCMVVHNMEAYHTWDLVQIDGHWYHTDIYSDAGSSNHSHFNRMDQMQMTDQTWDTGFFPATDSEQYCYAVMNAVAESDVTKIPAIIRTQLDEGGTYLAFRVPADEGDRTAHMLEDILNRIQTLIGSAPAYSGTEFYWQWQPVGKDYVVSISMSRSSGEGGMDLNLSEEDQTAIDGAMEEAFGDVEIMEYYEGGFYGDDECMGGPVG